MVTPPYKALRTVVIPDGEIPLVSPHAAPEKQVRQRLIAHARVFNLFEPKDLADYEAIWQNVCDSKSHVSETTTPELHEGKMLAFLRWSDVAFVAPQL